MIQNILQFSKWKHIKDEHIGLAILPWGATEAHNLHLPYGTDTILAEYISKISVEKMNKRCIEEGKNAPGTIILPSVAYGVNTGQMEVKLCMNLNPSTQLAILGDILEVLKKHKINRLVIVNGHGGNLFQSIIRELSLKYPEILVASINWWTVCKAEPYFSEPGDHAGELETACMMAIMPGEVLPKEHWGTGREKRLKLQGFREKWAWIPRRWVLATEDTGVGNPAAANAVAGERFLDDCTSKISKFLEEFAAAPDEASLYEN